MRDRADPAVQVLIREGPELGHKLAMPVIHYIQSILGLEASGRKPGQVVNDELPKLQSAVEKLPPLGLAGTLTPSFDQSTSTSGSRVV